MLPQRIGKKIKISLKRKRVLLALLLVILFLLFIFNFHNQTWELMNNIADKVGEKTGINLGKTFYDFESAINIFRPKKDLLSRELPIFELKLSKNDIKHFNALSEKSVQRGYLDKKENTWRKIELKYKGQSYNAEIKLHGDLSNHWANTIKSYKVKVSDNESINNLKGFNLIIFEDRTLSSRIAKILSKEFGLFDVRDDFIVLRINGVLQGLYYLVERLDNTFFEYNACSSCELIRTRDSKMKDHPREKENDNPNLDSWEPYGVNYLRSQHVTPFDYEVSQIDLEKSDLDLKKVLNSVNGLFQAIEEEDIPRLVDYFDVDQITSFEAQRMLLGFGLIMGDNLKMVYKSTNSKFYPIAFEGGLSPLKVEKGGLERGLNIYTIHDGEAEIKLFVLLNKNDMIRQLKYKKAYQYISNKEGSLLEKIDDLVKEYLPYANANKGGAKAIKVIEKEIKSFKPLLQKNMDIIKATLEYAKCYINIIENGNKVTLEVMPDSISQLNFDSFRLNLIPGSEYSGEIVLKYKDEDGYSSTKSINIEDKTNSVDLTSIIKEFYFMTGLDEDLGTKKRVYTIDLVFQNTNKILIDNVEIKVKNDVADKFLDDDEVYLQIADANDYYYPLIFFSPEEFMSMYNEFNWAYQNGVLTLLKGTYILNRDVIVPKGLTWDIEPGVQISIDEDKSIVSYSPVNIKGTESEPVVVKALDATKPFGVFGIVGEKGYKTTIDWLRISGGNEKFINGLYLSGQLSLYHTDVEMKNSVVSGSHSDDGINIKYGKMIVDNCLFTNNFADQFDGDFVEGVVKNSRFIEEDPNADVNGDGLDFSGSKVIVKNNLFKGFKDKGVSIGEGTRNIVLYDNLFENNNLGAAIKDASYAFFIKNSFKNNEVALSAYQKKIIYPSGGYFYLYDNDFESNMKDYELDEKSYKEDLKIDKGTYNQIVGYVAEEDLEALFPVLNPFIKND